MKQSDNRNRKGMTLVEVLVSVFLLTVGILAALLFLTRAMTATSAAKDLTVATTHAEYVMEEMRSLQNIFSITSRDWNAWANQEGLDSLPEEKIETIFENAIQGPLRVQVAVSWKRKGRESRVMLETELTR